VPEREGNPFEVLRLDPSADGEAIVRRAGQLRQRASSEQEINAIRQAVQVLMGDAAERCLHEWLTPGNPHYPGPAVDRLAALFRRTPAAPAPTECPPVDAGELAELLRPLLIERWRLPPLPLDASGTEDTPDEIRRQLVEALWQCLVHDSRG
jgi:hypothetical protein